MKNKKEIKKAMLTIYNWAKDNNINYFAFSAFPFGITDSVTGKHTPTTSINLTYTIKDAEKWEKGYEGLLVKNNFYKKFTVDLEDVGK